jgi:3-deoxy-D-manno-octulosonic-acid transferase
LAKMFMKPSWNALSLACANSEEDALALQSLGVSTRAVRTTGDPGIDSAVHRFLGRDLWQRWHALLQADPRPTVVAGSTWVSDEDVLLPALVSTRETVTDLRLIIAPHKPSELAVAKLIERLEKDGWWATTLSSLENALTGDASEVSLRPNAIVVDRVGVLANLYGLASVSFVGGGFHGRGLHSVLEPAVAESGVLFGSQHHRARAAADLIDCGGAESVQNVEELTEVITTWLTDEARRKAAGAASAEYIHSNRGAAIRSATLLESLLRVK